MGNKLFSVVTMMLLYVSVIAQKTGGDDIFLVKPYLQYSTKNSIRILWETKFPTESEIRYGKAPVKGPKGIELDQISRIQGKRVFHELELKNLEEETNYFWKVTCKTPDGTSHESQLYTFKSSVKDSSAYMFALIGDAQRNKKTPWAWDSIAAAVWKERPSFVINAGDLVDWGHNKEEWVNEFLGPGHKLMSRVPMYTVLGNHEGDADYYYQYMANPEPEYRYTFKYGNAAFFMVDSNRDLSEGSDQFNWLEQELAKSTSKWKIVVHHHPPYSSESDDHGKTFNGDISTMGHIQVRDLPKLYDKYGVDFCLFGHTHVYERTWPLKDNRINQREGTIYINSGGAGGILETFAPTRNWFTQELREGHHYCTFAVFDNDIVFKAIDHEGRLFDTFQLNKQRDKDLIAVVQPPAPIIRSDKFMFHDKTVLEMEKGLGKLTVRYTLDGSEPTVSSPVYNGPFTITNSTTIIAKSYTEDQRASRTVTKEFTKVRPLPSKKIKGSKPGLRFQLYTGDWTGNMDGFFAEKNKKTEGLLQILDISDINSQEEYWGLHINGHLKISRTGTYTFYGYGSRGLSIEIDGRPIIRREHEQQQVVQLVLEKGYHELSIKSVQTNWRKAFGFGYWDEIMGRTPIPPFDLGHKD
ncbi:MAG: metallophosphoesterase [Bacteroidota bacterium]